jgi:hypothetical protein
VHGVVEMLDKSPPDLLCTLLTKVEHLHESCCHKAEHPLQQQIRSNPYVIAFGMRLRLEGCAQGRGEFLGVLVKGLEWRHARFGEKLTHHLVPFLSMLHMHSGRR